MSKNDKMKLMKVFDNICKNKQYVQYYKGCRIISYNNANDENLVLQFHHRLNDFIYSTSYVLNELYIVFDLDLINYYYKDSLKLAFKNFEKQIEKI